MTFNVKLKKAPIIRGEEYFLSSSKAKANWFENIPPIGTKIMSTDKMRMIGIIGENVFPKNHGTNSAEHAKIIAEKNKEKNKVNS